MVGALVTADRALNSASREAASVDALESSHLIEQALSQQVGALSSLRGALMTAGVDRDRALQQLATEIAHEAPSLRELRVADSSGRVLYPPSTSSQPAPASRRVPTIAVDANKNVVLDVPLALNGRSLGSAVARFEAIGLFRDALSSVPETRVRL